MEKIIKWNWSGFWFVLILCCLGFLSNKNIPDVKFCFIATLIFDFPFGLLIAYISRGHD